MEDILEEIKIIKTIYCQENEVVIDEQGPESVILSVHVQRSNSRIEILLTLSLSSCSYPSSPPLLSVKSPQLTRTKCDYIKLMLRERCEQLMGEPMLFQIISSLHEYVEKNLCSDCGNSEEKVADVLTTCLLQIDHMRSKQHYSKMIYRWSDKLDIVGRLIFCQKSILILLQGSKEAIKDYICLNRSQSVDVDSRGNPCKERLLSVLYNDFTSHKKVYSDFATYDVTSLESLKAKLKEDGLIQLSELLENLIKK